MVQVENADDLLGLRENEHLEFKREVHANGAYLEAVVAFLNTSGGDLYFGVGESGDRAVEIIGVADPVRDAHRIIDSIADRIEPRPEFTPPRRISHADGRTILHLNVPKSGRVHVLRDGARYSAAVRVADRNRALSWAEIRERLGQPETDSGGLARTLQAMMKKRTDFLAADGGTTLRVACWPHPPGSDLIDVRSDEVREILQDGNAIGVRASGWNYLSNSSIEVEQAAVETGLSGNPTHRHVRITKGGTVEFHTDRDSLWSWSRIDEERAIYPFVLIEYPVSVLRLAAWLLARSTNHLEKVLVELCVRNARGLRLGPGDPRSLRYAHEHLWNACTSDALCVGAAESLVAEADDFVANPDRVAFRLVREAYEAFGFEESEIPFFDAAKERFVLPA